MTTTISERRRQRQAERDAERERKRRNTIKYVEVLDAFHSKPQYLGEYDEDGERPVLNHPHAWFILVTLADGTRWFSRESTPFSTFSTHDMKRDLANGCKVGGEQKALFQAGPRHVMFLEGLIAKARMEERAEAIRQARVLDPDSAEWGRWPYSERGSAAWEAEMHAHEMNDRRNPNNW